VSLRRRLENVERWTGGGCCPHLPPLVTYRGDGPAVAAEEEPPCWCGRPRVEVEVLWEPRWRLPWGAFEAATGAQEALQAPQHGRELVD
jgi:hypothetical protein